MSICKGYSPYKGYTLCKMADFQHRLISRIFGFFSSGFLHRISPMRIQNRFWHFLSNLKFWSKLSNCKGYSPCKGYRLCKVLDFQHRLISGIFGVFSSSFFAQNYSNVNTESILTCFRQFKILAQIEYFARAIAHTKAIHFARWPIFNMVSFLEYSVFFRSVFCTELLQCEYRIDFDMF